MPKHGKRYVEAAALVDRETAYDPEQAVQLLKETAKVNFDPSVEAHIRLGVDPRHADQMVRGTVVLPHGVGKTIRVLVFAQGDKAAEASGPARTRLVPRTWSRRSRPATWTSTSRSRPPT